MKLPLSVHCVSTELKTTAKGNGLMMPTQQCWAWHFQDNCCSFSNALYLLLIPILSVFLFSYPVLGFLYHFFFLISVVFPFFPFVFLPFISCFLASSRNLRNVVFVAFSCIYFLKVIFSFFLVALSCFCFFLGGGFFKLF